LQTKNETPPVVCVPLIVPWAKDSTGPQLLASHVGTGALKVPVLVHDVDASPLSV
jgi:hypothetical protein